MSVRCATVLMTSLRCVAVCCDAADDVTSCVCVAVLVRRRCKKKQEDEERELFRKQSEPDADSYDQRMASRAATARDVNVEEADGSEMWED